MCTSYRVSILVFVLVTSAVTSQSSLVKLGSLSDINDQDSGEMGKTTGSFSEVFWKKVLMTDIPPLANSSTKSDQLHTVVLRRFTKEMGSLFVTLPVNTQCGQLLIVTKMTTCNSSTLQNWTSLRMNVSKCSWHGKVKEQSKTCNRTAAIKQFQTQMGWVFESLPWSFKCNIVNLIAQSYRGQSQASISVHEAEDAIEKLFHFIHIRQQCSMARPKVFLPQVSLVHLRVKLNNGMTKKAWLKNFTSKGPQIYDLYLKYQQKSYKNRPLPGTPIRKPLPANDVPPSQIYVDEVSEGAQEFYVDFGLKIKKKGQFRVMKSTYKIVSSLKNVEADKLNAVLQAKVLEVDLKNDQAAISPTPSDGDAVWTHAELQRAQSLFPKNLTDYYKQVSHVERCFIMFQISSSFGRSPKQMEALYNALRFVIRRRSCYLKRVHDGTMSFPPVHTDYIGERLTPQTTHPTLEYTDVSFKSTPVAEGQDQNKQLVEGGDSESGVSSLEYALFILLGLLCVATLAFTINYALFALRRSPNHTNRHLPNGMLPSEVVQQNVVRERSHCVHVTHNNQHMAKQEQQLPFVCTKSLSMRYDSAVPCASHSTQSFVDTSDLGPAGSGTDSGYSQSQETCAPSPNSGAMRDLHSDTELYSQISGNSKGIQQETELSPEAETSTSPNPDASADLECRPNSEASLCLDSNIQSPSQKPQGEGTCSATGDSQNELSCTQSYETLSPEAACDRGGIKEVQV